MKYAVINQDGIVENIILANEGFQISGKILVPADGANIGYIYQDGGFVAPNDLD